MRTFIALSTFESPETKSVYVEGLTYSIREGNRYLNALAEVWSLEGRIRFEHRPEVKSQIEGVGTVEYKVESQDLTLWEKTVKAWRLMWQSLTPRQ